MARPSAMDERFVHQIPQLLTDVATRHAHWRESYFFEIHRPDARGDVVFLTMARYPARGLMDSLQMGRVDGEQLLGALGRPLGDDPHTTALPGVTIEVVEPFEELRLWADPEAARSASTSPSAPGRWPTGCAGGRCGRGTTSSGTSATSSSRAPTPGPTPWAGCRARWTAGWGNETTPGASATMPRCPLWLWFQIQFEDGFLGVWHWELANGARVYTDGCWAGTDRSDPVPIVDFSHDMRWLGPGGAAAAFGEHGEAVTGLGGSCVFTLEGGRRIEVEAAGTFDRPYEPFQRGGLSQMRVRADDGREGTAIYEVTGSRHHRYFPDTVVEGTLPS